MSEYVDGLTWQYVDMTCMDRGTISLTNILTQSLTYSFVLFSQYIIVSKNKYQYLQFIGKQVKTHLNKSFEGIQTFQGTAGI